MIQVTQKALLVSSRDEASEEYESAMVLVLDGNLKHVAHA